MQTPCINVVPVVVNGGISLPILSDPTPLHEGCNFGGNQASNPSSRKDSPKRDHEVAASASCPVFSDERNSSATLQKSSSVDFTGKYLNTMRKVSQEGDMSNQAVIGNVTYIFVKPK